MRLTALLAFFFLPLGVAQAQQPTDASGISACQLMYELHAGNPRLPVDRPLLALAVGPFPLHKPPHWVSDSVLLAWVVDTSGMIEPATIRVDSAVGHAFRDEMITALGHWRFRPALVRDCAVPAYYDVVMRFN